METQIGIVTHYYSHPNVAVLQLTDRLKLGETIHIFGQTTDFVQKVTSLEVNHHKVTIVEPCNYVAIKVREPVRVHDAIYRVMRDVMDLQTL